MSRKPGSLLFVNQHYHPDVASTGQQLTDLAEYLAAEGWTVDVLCGRARYDGAAADAKAVEDRNGVQIHRVWNVGFSRTWHGRRLFGYAVFNLQVLVRLAFGPRRRGVVLLTTPPLLPLVGYLLSRVRRLPYGIWAMDLHPEAEVAAGMLEETSPLNHLLRRLALAAYRNADFVIDLGPFMKRRLLDLGVDPALLHTVAPWSGRDEIRPLDRETNPLAVELALKRGIVVGYFGNAGIAHQFEDLLEAISALSGDPSLRFLFVGAGPRRPEIEAYAERHQLSNLDYLDYFPRERLGQTISLPDVHLVSLRPEFAGIAVPSKLYGIMAAARPVLFVGPRECETASTIEKAACGSVVDPHAVPDPAEKIAQVLSDWSRDPETRKRLGDAGRKAFLRCFERRVNCARFEEVVTDAWGPPAAGTNP